jgi:hypothetical protein
MLVEDDNDGDTANVVSQWLVNIVDQPLRAKCPTAIKQSKMLIFELSPIHWIRNF